METRPRFDKSIDPMPINPYRPGVARDDSATLASALDRRGSDARAESMELTATGRRRPRRGQGVRREVVRRGPGPLHKGDRVVVTAGKGAGRLATVFSEPMGGSMAIVLIDGMLATQQLNQARLRKVGDEGRESVGDVAGVRTSA